jgi:hypothetical protein
MKLICARFNLATSLGSKGLRLMETCPPPKDALALLEGDGDD